MTNGKRSHETIKVYACSYSRDRGKTVCSNTLRRPVESVNHTVTDWIKSNVLSEELILDTNSNLLHGARAEIRAAAVATASASSRLR